MGGKEKVPEKKKMLAEEIKRRRKKTTGKPTQNKPENKNSKI